MFSSIVFSAAYIQTNVSNNYEETSRKIVPDSICGSTFILIYDGTKMKSWLNRF